MGEACARKAMALVAFAGGGRGHLWPNLAIITIHQCGHKVTVSRIATPLWGSSQRGPHVFIPPVISMSQKPASHLFSNFCGVLQPFCCEVERMGLAAGSTQDDD